MKIVTREVEIPRVIKQRILYCENCDTEMLKDNIVLTSNPPQYRYTCPKCNSVEYSIVYFDNKTSDNYGNRFHTAPNSNLQCDTQTIDISSYGVAYNNITTSYN